MLACCFTGHRVLSEAEQQNVLNTLNDKIQEIIDQGVTVFRNGGALGFDTLAALHILALKKKYPQIKLYMDLPHRGQAQHWTAEEQRVYEYILACADKVTYVSDTYRAGCMQKRNRYMVDRSDYVIAYVRKVRSGSYYTACYAESLEKNVIYL